MTTPASGSTGTVLLSPGLRLAAMRDLAVMLLRDGLKPTLRLMRDLALIQKSGLFDPLYYLNVNRDVAASGLHPAVHYLRIGAAEGRPPGPQFDGTVYAEAYTDVAVQGVNPLVHFLRYGRAEGRMAGVSAQAEATAADIKTRKASFYSRLALVRRHRMAPLQPPAARPDPACLDLHWIIPDFRPGAGGHMTIFRICRFLETFGHRITLWIHAPGSHATPEAAGETLRRHFQPLKAEVRFLPEDPSDLTGDAVIATDRWTCYPVQAMTAFHRRFYFVQDHEPDFYPHGAEYLLAQNTYRMNFDCLCAGEWLDGLMRDTYGLWSRKWDLAYDPDVYFPPAAGHRRSPLRIAFYARYVTARRAVELGMLALDELAARGVDFHVDFFGWSLPTLDVAYSYTDHGVLDSAGLGALYRECAIGVVFSCTNHSLLPREMMACGLPVIELDTPSTRAVFSSEDVVMASSDPLAMADTLAEVLGDAVRRQAISDHGVATVTAYSWERSARAVEAAIRERLGDGSVTPGP